MRETIKAQKSSLIYVASGLFRTFMQVVVGFLVLRWIEPGSLGQWQSLLLMSTYLSILTLGTTSAINRELPFLLGKNQEEQAMGFLSSVGYFTEILSWLFIISSVFVGSFFWFQGWYKWDFCIELVLAAINGAINIQTNFIGSTFRTSNSFQKVGKVQFLIAFGYVALIPLIYYGNIGGYIVYQTVLSVLLYLGYWWYRPFKIKYRWNLTYLKVMVKEGFHLYVWNYLSTVSKSFPRLALVVFANPYSVGLYAPAQNVNTAILNLPSLLNRVLFPKMSFKFGQSGKSSEVIRGALKWSGVIFMVMSVIAMGLTAIIPWLFNSFFPKYTESIDVAIVALWAGVLYSVNSIFQLTITSIKAHKELYTLIIMRFVFLALGILVALAFLKSWLLIVSFSALFAEILNICHGLYILRKKMRT
ncbi:MAG: hypothetical protein FJX95_02950 [Bacteroidetes bacterium]|nr:hypothetical protein [Bacteroidota bacterium]